MRLFLAINLPPDERRAIRRATTAMRDAAHGVAWVGEERLHLTMKFLGEQPDAALAPLCETLAEVAAKSRSFDMRLGGLGAFPNLRAPRVVWMGVEHVPPLELLQHDVERACHGLGYELDGRAFRPHITLGRARDRMRRDEAKALARAAREVRYASTVNARTLDLMASELLAEGSRYRVLAELSLGGGGR